MFYNGLQILFTVKNKGAKCVLNLILATALMGSASFMIPKAFASEGEIASDSPAIAAPKAREHSLLKDGTIRLSDIFSGLTDSQQQIPIGKAPNIGQPLILSSDQIQQIAKLYTVDWQADSSLKGTLVLERASLTLTSEMIAETIEAALSQNLLDNGLSPEDVTISIAQRLTNITLPADPASELVADITSFNPEEKIFTAALWLDNGINGAVMIDGWSQAVPTVLQGKIAPVVYIPVLAQDTAAGDTITEGDIEMLRMPSDKVPNGAFTKTEDLIGLSPKRALTAFRPILNVQVEYPTLVKKGDRVTITLKTAMMQLSAQGIALENGSKGNTIRVSNEGSRKIVDATVESSGNVTVNGISVANL